MINIEIAKIEGGLWNEQMVIDFANWASYRYIRQTDGSWKRRGGGWDKKNIGGTTRYTTKQLIEYFKKEIQ